MRSLVLFFFVVALLNSLLWALLVPMWHTPDEQAHFAQVAYLFEKGGNPGGRVLDTTEEIYITEQLLGTARDRVGNNKFTFHPDFNIEYTNSFFGKYEASIAALVNTDAKKKFVFEEATRYPTLYYIPATWLYKLFYHSDIITRVFVIRGWSLLLFIINIFIVYRIGKLVFLKNKLQALILATLVGFQPMMVFANIGVASDSLGNLLFTLFLYLSLRLIIHGVKLTDLILLGFVSWQAMNTKTQFVIILPVIFILLAFLVLRDIRKETKYIILAVLLLFAAVLITHPYSFRQLSPLIVTADSLREFNLGSFAKFTLEYTLPHTINEVMPWYWGVYKWLGVTYPRIVHRIINRIVFVSAIGFIFWFVQIIRKKSWNSHQTQGIIFVLFVSLIYFLAISVYDWLSWYRTGFQLAVQGRYFFPLISVHMMAILVGWSTLLPKKWNIKQYGLKFLAGSLVIFNIYALYFVASSYYDTSSLQQFIIQESQYKPLIIKGIFLEILLLATLVSLIIFLMKFILCKEKEQK